MVGILFTRAGYEDAVDFVTALRESPIILTEGALIERLRRDPAVSLDPHVLHAGFVYDEGGREALRGLYRQYLDIGLAADLPMIVCTPTWRANPVRLRQAGLADRDVNGDGARFVAAIRDEYGAYARRVFVGGLIGCTGDAYKPEEGLSTDAGDRVPCDPGAAPWRRRAWISCSPRRCRMPTRPWVWPMPWRPAGFRTW